METVKDYILYALIAVGVAVVALMYSPYGSPQLYEGDKEGDVVSSVRFDGPIVNAPRQSFSSHHAHTPFDNGLIQSTINFRTSSSSSSVSSSSGTMSSHYSMGVSQHDYTLKSSGGGGGGGEMAFASQGKKTNDDGQGAGMGGFGMRNNSGSSVLNTSSPFSPKIAAPYATNEGGMDPGADPTSEPLPLEDDMLMLLVFALGYFVFKKYDHLWRLK